MKIAINQEMSLLEALALAFPEASKTTLRSWIDEGRVVSGDQPIKKNIVVGPKSRITLRPRSRYLGDLKILYEDRDIVVVEKPEGLLSVDTDQGGSHNVHSILRKRFGNVWPVQRLDRETSGVMVFALSAAAKEHLKKQFSIHSIYREYFAIVEGRMEGEGTWKSSLIENEVTLSVRSVTPGREKFGAQRSGAFQGKAPLGSKGSPKTATPTRKEEVAITHYKVLEATDRETRLQLILDTGKKHQIRVQASEAGHPVIGDKRYGSGAFSKRRLALHAHKLAFIHPTTQKKLQFISPKPFR